MHEEEMRARHTLYLFLCDFALQRCWLLTYTAVESDHLFFQYFSSYHPEPQLRRPVGEYNDGNESVVGGNCAVDSMSDALSFCQRPVDTFDVYFAAVIVLLRYVYNVVFAVREVYSGT